MASNECPYLFGGHRPWSPTDWTAVDDRVRGGASQSHLVPSTQNTAIFSGTLDITTLGGAGFASQRSADSLCWDLSGAPGLEIRIDAQDSDDKRYTLTLKDEILPRRPDGREQSTVSWEFDFSAADARGSKGRIQVRWEDLRPTYRGKEVEGVKPLDLRSVRRVSFMMRSFFGEQAGEFRLVVRSVKMLGGMSPGERYIEEIAGKEGLVVVAETAPLEVDGHSECVADLERRSAGSMNCCVIL